MTVRYKFPRGQIKMELISTFMKKEIDPFTAVACAHECVDAGRTTEYWRKRMGNESADALDGDLKDMKLHG